MADSTTRRTAASRLLTPSGLGLALIGFLFGFVAVSCDTPGGYGRTGQGGTTTYSGLDLALGTPPTVDAAHLRPELASRPDLLGWQPLLLLAALAIIAGMVAGASAHRLRRRIVLSATALAVALLVVGELLAHSQLTDQLAAQLSRPLPPDRTPADYVVVGGGFTTALALTAVVLACHLVAHLRHHRRRGPQRTATDDGGPQRTVSAG